MKDELKDWDPLSCLRTFTEGQEPPTDKTYREILEDEANKHELFIVKSDNSDVEKIIREVTKDYDPYEALISRDQQDS